MSLCAENQTTEQVSRIIHKGRLPNVFELCGTSSAVLSCLAPCNEALNYCCKLPYLGGHKENNIATKDSTEYRYTRVVRRICIVSILDKFYTFSFSIFCKINKENENIFYDGFSIEDDFPVSHHEHLVRLIQNIQILTTTVGHFDQLSLENPSKSQSKIIRNLQCSEEKKELFNRRGIYTSALRYYNEYRSEIIRNLISFRDCANEAAAIAAHRIYTNSKKF